MHNAFQSERVAPQTARNTVFIAVIAAVAGTVWATVTELPEMAFAKGSIQPTGSLRRVEHLDGGVVEEILVSEGDVLSLGTEIVQLNDVSVDAEIEKLRVRERVLNQALDRSRLVLNTIGFDGRTEARATASDMRTNAQMKSYEATRLRLSKGITAARGRIAPAEADVANQSKRRALEQRELARIRSLHAGQLIGDEALYESEVNANATTAALLDAKLNLQRVNDSVIDAEVALDEFFARTRESLLTSIEETMEELSLVQRAIIDNRLRRDRIVVRSPVNGVVQALYLNSEGEVVEPGGLIAEVLPTTESLIAELQILPRDIGHIDVGDPVDINLSTFDAKQYGAITGWVQQISPTSTQNDVRETYYVVRVSLEQQIIGPGEIEHQLKSGMEVNASIRTGERSVMNYVLSPVLTSLDQAFRER